MGRPRGHRLDALDFQLLRFLSSREPPDLAGIATRIGLSYSSCRKRVEHLLEAGLIERAILISEEKSQWRSSHLVMLKLRDNADANVRGLGQHLIGITNVISCDEVGGYWDIMVRIATKDVQQLGQIRQRIESFHGLERTETIEIMKPVKAYRLPPEALYDEDKI